jgi:hypothetical protein
MSSAVVCELSEMIVETEPLSRYILNKAYLRADGSVRWNAFIPTKSGETSVYRIFALSEYEIWKLGKEYVANHQQKQLLGRADFTCHDVIEIGLAAVSAPHPHPRHANLTRWPAEKPEQRLFAMKLEARSTAHVL